MHGRADLAKLADVDLFYSIIVLQHNPPPVMMEILDRAFASLRPDGVAFFQIQTYSMNYTFSAQDYLKAIGESKGMEMHFLPHREIFDLARQHDVFPVEVQPDWCGIPGQYNSTAFLFRKQTGERPRWGGWFWRHR